MAYKNLSAIESEKKPFKKIIRKYHPPPPPMHAPVSTVYSVSTIWLYYDSILSK